MTEVHNVARDQLKSIVQRVERLESEIADLNADKSDIYKEARSNGFDVKAIKKVVSKRKLDENEREEQDAVFDTYWDAVHGTNLVHARAREKIEEFDPTTGEFLDDEQPETASETPKQVYGDSGEEATALPSQSVNIPAGGENAQEIDGSNETCPADDNSPETATRPGQDVQSPSQRAMAGENLDVTGGESAAGSEGSRQSALASELAGRGNASDKESVTVVGPESGTVSCEYCDSTGDVHRIDGEWLGFCHCEHGKRLRDASDCEIDPTEDRKEGQSLGGNVGANIGGDHVTDHQSFAAQAGAPFSKTAPAKLLRPHCRNPQMCGSGTIDHCHSCKVAMRERDVA